MKVDQFLKINSSGDKVKPKAKPLKPIKKTITLYIKEELNNIEIPPVRISTC